VALSNTGGGTAVFALRANKYYAADPTAHEVPSGGLLTLTWALENGPWYDFSLTAEGEAGFGRRFAGRMETGLDSFSDPAMEGVAVGEQRGPLP
jgi:phospholipase C